MKKDKIKILAITLEIMSIIISFVGIALAYYYSSLLGEETSLNVKTETIGNITFNSENFMGSNNITPGWIESKIITMEINPSTIETDANLVLTYTNTFSSLLYKSELISIKEGEAEESLTNPKVSIINTSNYTSLNIEESAKAVLSIIDIMPHSEKITVKIKVYVTLSEDATNLDMGKTFNGSIYVEKLDNYTN